MKDEKQTSLPQSATSAANAETETPRDSEATAAFAALVRKNFSVRLPIILTPPEPAAFGYHCFDLRLSPVEGGGTVDLEAPQVLFMQFYELCLKLSGAIPSNTTLTLKFTPYHEVRQ